MAFRTKKRGAQRFASGSCLEKCQVSELLWACTFWDPALLSRGQDIWGPGGVLECVVLLFLKCQIKNRDLVQGPGAAPGA